MHACVCACMRVCTHACTHTHTHTHTSKAHIPGEEESLLFQVVVQPSLNVIQHGLKAKQNKVSSSNSWLMFLLLFTFLVPLKHLVPLIFLIFFFFNWATWPEFQADCIRSFTEATFIYIDSYVLINPFTAMMSLEKTQ